MTLKKITLVLLSALNFAGLSSIAIAHDNATLDTMKSPHGGVVRMAGQYHFELVSQAKDKTLIVYVTDHSNKEIPVASLKGTMMILSQGTRVNLTLKPHATIKNALIAGADLDPNQVNISVTIDGQIARFIPKK